MEPAHRESVFTCHRCQTKSSFDGKRVVLAVPTIAKATLKGDVPVYGNCAFHLFVLGARFFTVGTLFGFAGGFGAFLEFLRKGLFEKVSSLDEEKLLQIVKGSAVCGVVGDEHSSRRASNFATSSARRSRRCA